MRWEQREEIAEQKYTAIQNIVLTTLQSFLYFAFQLDLY